MLFSKVVYMLGMILSGPGACSCVHFHKNLFKKDCKMCQKLVMFRYWKSVFPISILRILFTQLIELIEPQLLDGFLLLDNVWNFLLSRKCSFNISKCLLIGLPASELFGAILGWDKISLRWRFWSPTPKTSWIRIHEGISKDSPF